MTATTATATALSAAHVSKTFASQRALSDVSITIERGEIHALVGPNGCGKSTFVKALAGYHEPDPGAVAEVAGVPFDIGSAAAARGAGLRFVHQNLGLIDSLDVADNFCLEGGQTGVGKLDRRAERRARPGRPSSASASRSTPAAMVSTLAASERTAIAVARALADTGNPRAAAGARRAHRLAARARGRPPVRRPAPRRRERHEHPVHLPPPRRGARPVPTA